MTNHITTSQVRTTAATLALAVYSASILGIELDAALITDPAILAKRTAEALAQLADKSHAKNSTDHVGV